MPVIVRCEYVLHEPDCGHLRGLGLGEVLRTKHNRIFLRCVPYLQRLRELHAVVNLGA